MLSGCGKNDDGASSPATTAFNPTAATVTGSPTTGVVTSSVGASGVAQNVVDGASCTQQGARGTTKDGLAELCALVGGETRWRPA